MATLATATVSDVRGAANEWLISCLPDRFATGMPRFDQTVAAWRIPVWLSYPQLEPFGPVGELVIDAVSTEVIDHTPADEMKKRAVRLYEQHRDRVEAPLP